MAGLPQPSHLIFIVLGVLILLGSGILPGTETLRRKWSNLVSANRSATSFGFQCLLAILIGNTLYFVSWPFFPNAAKMGAGSSPGLPALVDLWFCLFVFGALNLSALLRRRNKPKK